MAGGGAWLLAMCLVSMDVLLALWDEADGSLEAGEIREDLVRTPSI
ncbi:Protein SCAR (Protein WAVE) [Psidium guajava]|nr:Protein SCAR (Protein WAVE) [Psidium guajava]